MDTSARKIWAITAAMLCGMPTAPVTKSTDPPLAISVMINNRAGVPAATLAEAQRIATSVYRRIGLEIVWIDDAAAFDASAPHEREARAAALQSLIVLHLVPPSVESRLHLPLDVMGQAFRGSRIAAIFYGRVLNLTHAGVVTVGDALGYVMAHELGHLLLPYGGHSPDGLMRDRLDQRLMSQHLLGFDRRQADAIRASLSASQFRFRPSLRWSAHLWF